ncbi:hypothetical protein A8O28_18875 [Enterobacteriaceae bacterium CCUG 67584]|nr:hypothetical protein [Enterobacteriaceae bacterium CCUG 67584]
MTKITERGMIFNGEMVRAILDGRKTQTRRVMKDQPVLNGNFYEVFGAAWSKGMTSIPAVPGHSLSTRCPYGVVGDRIWVRETWAEAGAGAPDLKLYRSNYPAHVPSHYENVPPAEDIRWTPSIHMPRWASRILLEITDVRVERLNSISEGDACAEGVEFDCMHCDGPFGGCDCTQPDSAEEAFATLWKSIYGKESWQANPWVWVIEFKRIEGDGHATD